MFYEELKENYTKVSVYKKPFILDVAELPKLPLVVDWRKTVIRIGVTAALVTFGLDLQVFAAEGSSLGKKAEEFYFGMFLDIAKWAIIVKGGWDVVSKSLKEDFDGAKKSVMSYLLIFAVLMGLPWALGIVEDIFREESL